MDLQLRDQYQSLERGDVKLYVFPSTGRERMYKIVIGVEEAELVSFINALSKGMAEDLNSVVRPYYDYLTTTRLGEEYHIDCSEPNQLWVNLESIILRLYEARGRVLYQKTVTIRVAKVAFAHLLVIAKLTPSFRKGASLKFYDVLAKVYSTLQEEQL